MVVCSRVGVGKLFSRRAALTISRVVEGQGLSRTAACYRRNSINSQFCEMFWQCGISARKNGGVPKKKKKGHHLFFVDGKCVIEGNCRLRRIFRLRKRRLPFFKDTVAFAPCQSPCRIYFKMAKFQKVFAGRTECSRGP